MGLLVYLVILFVVGLFVGALARLLLPGRDPMSVWMTAGVGLLGTFSAACSLGMSCIAMARDCCCQSSSRCSWSGWCVGQGLARQDGRGRAGSEQRRRRAFIEPLGKEVGSRSRCSSQWAFGD